MKYANIIFIQSVSNHIAEKAHDGIKCPIKRVWNKLYQWPTEKAEKALLNYLKQWDQDSEYDLRDELSAGTNDVVRQFGNYVLIYNTRLDYVGLERIVTE